MLAEEKRRRHSSDRVNELLLSSEVIGLLLEEILGRVEVLEDVEVHLGLE
jgi:hypothetical protein